MKPSELNADLSIATLLKGNVKVQTSAKASRAVAVYAQGQQPQTDLADEFIICEPNGKISSLTQPVGIYTGNVALTMYCKCNADGTIKRNRVLSMVEQCTELLHGQSADGFYFGLNADNVIMPMTTNLINGYASMALNVEWRSQY